MTTVANSAGDDDGFNDPEPAHVEMECFLGGLDPFNRVIVPVLKNIRKLREAAKT